jgi:hypothetical protein
VRIFQSLTRQALPVLVICALFAGPSHGASTPKPTKPAARPPAVQLVDPIHPATRDWVEKQLIASRNVVLSNAYLFQVMKGIAQENQKAIEEAVLVPQLGSTLKGLAEAAKDPETKRLFAVPLIMLDGTTQEGFPTEFGEQAARLTAHPLFKPRGHYTDSEALQRFFASMQFLSRATIDVSTDPLRFPFPKEMLFPFETIQSVRELLLDPAHEPLRGQWLLIDSFFSEVNGPPDLPTFRDVLDSFPDKPPTRDDITAWAKARDLPKINPERGLGIQPFGERFTLHEAVIDEFKRKLFRDDTTRETIADTLRFTNLLTGSNHQRINIEGLAGRIGRDTGASYYSKVLQTIAVGARGWQRLPARRNFFAAALTSLAEQTVLMTKTSTIIQKSPPASVQVPDGLRLYFEPGSQRFLLGLADASAAMLKTCRTALDQVEPELRADVNLTDPTDAFRAFAALAKRSRPLITGSPLWLKHGKLVEQLPRRVAVTVDVFHLKDRSGNFHYYQWAIGPFDAAYRLKGFRKPVNGMETVFFEGWSDGLVPGSSGPLDNAEWEKRFAEGKLDSLRTMIPLPSMKEDQ